MAKGNGWLFLVLGILVLLFPWLGTGLSTLQWIETIAGLVIAILGLTMLGGKKK